MGNLIDGIWNESESQDYYKPTNSCIKINYDTLPKVATPHRYILYASLATPLAHVSVLVRTLKKLEKIVGVCLVSAEKDRDGWEFKKTTVGTRDRYNDCHYLHQLYTQCNENYSGSASIPLIWDNEKKEIISNCSFDILRFLNSYFNNLLTEETVDLYSKNNQKEIDSFIKFILEELYTPIFKVAYAKKQEDYDKYSKKIFKSLDELELLLKTQQTLLGDEFTIADWLLFTILIRFDVIFVPLFRLNYRPLSTYLSLSDYMTFLYQEEHIGCTVNINHIKEHYYKSYPQLNKNKIIPEGPKINFDYLSNRFSLL